MEKNEDDEESLDLVSQAIRKTGCLELHYAVQECIFEHKDWRRCQTEVQKFKTCMDNYHKGSSSPPMGAVTSQKTPPSS